MSAIQTNNSERHTKITRGHSLRHSLQRGLSRTKDWLKRPPILDSISVGCSVKCVPRENRKVTVSRFYPYYGENNTGHFDLLENKIGAIKHKTYADPRDVINILKNGHLHLLIFDGVFPSGNSAVW